VNKLKHENPNITIKEVIIRIQEEFGLNISKSTVHRSMQRMKFSYITPRPVHTGQDKGKQEEFKKNLKEIIGKHPEKELFFFDESRFGICSGDRLRNKQKALNDLFFA
jgi:hypothetical protein